MLNKDKFGQVVVAVVQNDESKFLLVHRKASEGKLSWNFPGGKVELGETVQQAAIREVREETGVECEVVNKITERLHPDTGRRVAYLLCRYKSGIAKVTEPDVVDKVSWLHPSEIFAKVTSNIAPTVDALLRTVARNNDNAVPRMRTLEVN